MRALFSLSSLAIATTTLAGSISTLAFADLRTDADAYARRGIALYNLGKYDDAIVAFENAYELVQSDALLFNLAQAHRKLDHCAPALRYYHQFLAGTPTPALATQVQELLPKLEAACRAKDEPPTAPASAAPAAPAPAPNVQVPAVTMGHDDGAAVAERTSLSSSPTQVRIEAGASVGGVASGGMAPTAGIELAAYTRTGPIEMGANLAVGQLWRSMANHDATLAHVAIAAAYRIPIDRLEVTLVGELGGLYVSSLDTASGVVPGIGRDAQWAPWLGGQAGAEYAIAPAWSVRGSLGLGFAPRMGAMNAPVTELDLVLGAVYRR